MIHLIMLEPDYCGIFLVCENSVVNNNKSDGRITSINNVFFISIKLRGILNRRQSNTVASKLFCAKNKCVHRNQRIFLYRMVLCATISAHFLKIP